MTEELNWPSLDKGPLLTGTYFVVYERGVNRFHEVALTDGFSEFHSLEAAIFGGSGAIRMLAGRVDRRSEKGGAHYVVVYNSDSQNRKAAIVVEPEVDGVFRASLLHRKDIVPAQMQREPVPQSAVRRAVIERVDEADLKLDDPSSYPAPGDCSSG